MKAVSLAVAVLLCLQLAQAYRLVQNYEGNNFFSGFDFWNQGDPTHGYVQYVDENTAQQRGYIAVDSNGTVLIRSDDKSVASGSGRGSVRISSKAVFNQNTLFIFDYNHQPFGCGTWPAVWLCGPNWPNGGEIDIVEGVNNNQKNQMTLHTGDGCSMSGVPRSQTGSPGQTNCNVYATGNSGCGVVDASTQSYGQGFNNIRGGVYAVDWTSSYIRIWFWPRNNIPKDISSGNPNPGGWGTPSADFPLGGNCPPSHFSNMQIIVDNTFCGDWAGAVFQSQGCGNNCQSFVQNNPGQFHESFWSINSFKVYQ